MPKGLACPGKTWERDQVDAARTLMASKAVTTIAKYISPVRPSSSSGLVAEVYRQIKRDFGVLGEPLTLHSPQPRLLSGAWAVLRETVLVGRVPREHKEAVAAVISDLNRCPYCVDAHTTMLHSAGLHRLANVVARVRNGTIEDPELAAIIAWAAATRSPGAQVLLSPPFAIEEAPELIGTAVVFHYINRVVTILLGESPLPGRGWLRQAAKWPAAAWFARAMRRPKAAGESLALLPDAPLPADLAWAAPSPTVAAAFARFAAVADEAGEEALDDRVRLLVVKRVEDWSGEDMGLGRRWVEEAVSPLEPALRAEGRLALLTALAPHQVDEGVVEEFRAKEPRPARLVGALAWSSFCAARRVAAWLS